MGSSSQRDGIETPLLFVYGTLRKGFRSHGVLQQLHARFLATGNTPGRLYDLGQYPGAVQSTSGQGCVAGEVYFLPRQAEAFRILDKFEGYNPATPALNLFERRPAAVVAAGGREVQAWIYWLASRRVFGQRIASGNYALRRR